MRRPLAALAFLLTAAGPGVVVAQTPTPQPSTPTIDGTALGVSLPRIQRRLAADSKAESTGSTPLKLEYYVDVYGTAPLLRFFVGESLVYGAVPGSAPTHRDMLWHVTPQQLRSPRVDLLGLAAGAAMYGARRMKDWQYDRDLAAYKKLIESGTIVPAPQPRRR